MERQERLQRLERLRYQRRGVARPAGRPRWGATLISIGLLCVALVVGGNFLAQAFARAITSPSVSSSAAATAVVTFVVKPGDTLSDVSERLAAQHIVGNGTLFYWYARTRGLDSSLVPGPYQVHTSSSWDQVVADLSPTASGAKEAGTENLLPAPIGHVKVTIPEGYRIEEIAARLQEKHIVKAATFISQARHGSWDTAYYTFLQGRPKGASLEGYLFPDTYELNVYTDTTTTARQAIGQMMSEFGQLITPALRSAFAKEHLSLYQGLTMAALVQREGQLSSELPLIASVYMNRLHFLHQETHYLGVDAAQRYYLGYDKATQSWWAPISTDDYNVTSPYNTFNPQHGVEGLPFGPICNPGLLSIKAAAHPAHTDYQYYVARGDGSHAFAKTNAEFITLKQQLGYTSP